MIAIEHESDRAHHQADDAGDESGAAARGHVFGYEVSRISHD
jgi:hypothetical protein